MGLKTHTGSKRDPQSFTYSYPIRIVKDWESIDPFYGRPVLQHTTDNKTLSGKIATQKKGKRRA